MVSCTFRTISVSSDIVSFNSSCCKTFCCLSASIAICQSAFCFSTLYPSTAPTNENNAPHAIANSEAMISFCPSKIGIYPRYHAARTMAPTRIIPQPVNKNTLCPIGPSNAGGIISSFNSSCTIESFASCLTISSFCFSTSDNISIEKSIFASEGISFSNISCKTLHSSCSAIDNSNPLKVVFASSIFRTRANCALKASAVGTPSGNTPLQASLCFSFSSTSLHIASYCA